MRRARKELGLSSLLAVAATSLGCGSGASSPSGCATAATPDLVAQGDFDVDTGLSSSTVGANYGQPACPGQYLVEVDMTGSAFVGSSTFSVAGFWSSVVNMQSCSLLKSTMNVDVFDGSSWQSWDVATYSGVISQTYCIPTPQHTDPGSKGLGVTDIPLTKGFQKARIAVNASQSGTPLAVAVEGSTP